MPPLDPQDAWATSKLATTLGYGNPDDFQGLDPMMLLKLAQHQSERALRDKELNDRAAIEQSRILAQIYGYDTQRDTALEQQQMRGEQEIEQLGQSTRGVGFGREQLASQAGVERQKLAMTLANMRTMQDMKMKIAQVQAASRPKISLNDFQMANPGLKGPALLDAYEQYVNRLSGNPIRQQLMGGGGMMR